MAAALASAGCVAVATGDAVHGRLDVHQGVRVLRLWGTPEQRGHAHGWLCADDICRIMRLEFAARFAARPELLALARGALPRLIEYPERIDRELRALWRGVLDRGSSRDMPQLGREFDELDLRVANALDVFGLLGCSSFAVWGERAAGGGVLTARNFDWPLTGPHMLDDTLLIVQHPDDGCASAAVAWPGYVGAVTGISEVGTAAFLHVGSGRLALPESDSWPSAVATRMILELAGTDLEQAARMLDYTSPPVGFLTHLALPRAEGAVPPFARFEVDTDRVVLGAVPAQPSVVTNHFRERRDGRPASADSAGREQSLRSGIAACFAAGDHVVDVAEAWRMLQSVEVSGRRGFGTLHAVVFRHDPWYFELRVAEPGSEGRLVGAASSSRRIRFERAELFGGGRSR